MILPEIFVCTIIGTINKVLYFFNVSNNVERTYNILITFVQLGVPCRNCTISKTCIFILKVDTKVSNSGDSLPLSLPT